MDHGTGQAWLTTENEANGLNHGGPPTRAKTGETGFDQSNQTVTTVGDGPCP